MAVDCHVARLRAEAGHVRVKAHVNDERALRGAVDTRLEQECVALSPELVAYLLSSDRVDRCLNLTGWHAGIEHQHVRSEIRIGWRQGGRAHSCQSHQEHPAKPDEGWLHT